MAIQIKKKVAAPVAEKAAAAPKVIEKAASAPAVQAVELKAATQESVTVTVRRQGAYACFGIELSCTKTVIDGADAADVIDGAIEMLHEKLNSYAAREDIQSLLENAVPGGVPVSTSEGAGEMFGEEPNTGTEPDLSAGAEEEITEELIRGMDKKALLSLIKDNNLSVDPKEYKKMADLAEAVIAELSEPAGEEGVGEENVIDEETIRAMDKKEILDLIKNEQLMVDPKEYKKLPDLIEAVIAELYVEDPGAGDGGFGDTDFGDA